MTTFTYSTLANNSASIFDPLVDVLVFDGGLVLENFDFSPIDVGPNAGLGVEFKQYDLQTGATIKTIQLLFSATPDPLNIYKLSSSHITFANGSLFMLGDDTPGVGDDTTTVTLTGGAGNDFLATAGGSQTLNGGNGNDFLATIGGQTGTLGGSGTDVFNGGNGIDTLGLNDVAGMTQYTVNLTLGTGSVAGANPSSFTLSGIENVEGSIIADSITGDANANSLEGWEGNDTLNGAGGNDTLLGRFGNDIILGGDGNDLIRGGDGSDSLNGGNGFDRVDYSNDDNNGTGVNVNLATGIATQGLDTDTLSGFEAVIGSFQNDTLTGGNPDQIYQFLRTDPSETFEGLSGNDIINGGSSAPTMLAIASYASSPNGIDVNLGTGSAVDGWGSIDTLSNIDFVIGSAFNDFLTGGSNSSQVIASNLFEQFEGGLGNDTINGAGGDDRVSYQNASASVTVNLATGTATGADGNDTLINIEDIRASNFADVLTGDSNNNSIEGLAGNDTIDGGAGFDQIRFSRSSGAVTVTFTGIGSGTANDGLGGTDTFSNIEEVRGSDQADTLTGAAGDESFMGMAGNDIINGGAGIDRVNYSASLSGVTVNLGSGTATDSWGNTDTLAGIENIRGSQFNDVLTGNAGDNVINGSGGNDTLNGGAGLDTASYSNAEAGVTVNLATTAAQNTIAAGTDTLSNFENLTGSDFNDMLTGSAGTNVLNGGLGDDTLNGGAGTDTVSYEGASAGVTVNLGLLIAQNTIGAGSDTLSNVENLTGNDFNDVLTGNALNNTLIGGLGNDALDGGAGVGDEVSYASASGAVSANLLTGVASGAAGSDTLANFEYITGSAFNDVLTGNALNNTLIGGLGNDTLDGGVGVDTVSYASATAAVAANLLTGTASGGAGSDTLANFENLTGSAFNDVLTGNALNNTLIGGLGNDTLDGGTGLGDVAFYGTATAAVSVNLLTGVASGAAGSDTLANFEYITGSNFNDTLTGNALNNTIGGGLGNDTLDGGTGVDTVFYASATAAVTVNLLTGTASGAAGSDTLVNFEYITGSNFNDVLTGDALTNTLIGGLGNDTLDGGAGVGDVVSYATATAAVTVNLLAGTASGAAGSDTLAGFEAITGSNFNDVLTGDALNNILIGGLGNDTLDGGAGVGDVVSYVTATAAVTVNLLTGTTSGAGGSDTLSNLEFITGSNFADTLTGNALNNTIIGGLGNDTLDGGAGIDTVFYATATGAVSVNLLTGTATGAAGSDTLSNFEAITGSNFNDTLVGNGVANTLIGGAGADTLTGGAGADFFLFNSKVSADTITDFVSGSDKLRFSQAGIRLGDGDTVVDGGIAVAGPGGFNAAAELVIVQGNIAGALSTTSAAAAIGSANTAYALGATALFAVDNGTSSGLYLFTSAGADAGVSSSELILLGVANNTASTALADYVFVG